MLFPYIAMMIVTAKIYIMIMWPSLECIKPRWDDFFSFLLFSCWRFFFFFSKFNIYMQLFFILFFFLFSLLSKFENELFNFANVIGRKYRLKYYYTEFTFPCHLKSKWNLLMNCQKQGSGRKFCEKNRTLKVLNGEACNRTE